MYLGPKAATLSEPSDLLLRLLRALSPAIVLVAVVQALKAEIGVRTGIRLCGLLLVNTLVAIVIGMLVVTAVQPGKRVHAGDSVEMAKEIQKPHGPVAVFLDNVPTSLVEPFVSNQIIGVIIIAVAFGVALRQERKSEVETFEDLVDLAMRTVATMLNWVISIVPIAVFGTVASETGVKGFSHFAALGQFVIAVLVAFVLLFLYYMLRVQFGSWVRPAKLLRGTRDALVMAFSTGSSIATMPVTYACVKERVGVRQRSAGLGVLVASNFTHDGTALYVSMSTLFVAQLLGADISLHQLYLIMLTSLFVSVGAAGIPQAAIVMLSLTLNSIGLPAKFIPLILTVDWFLDRCETVINVTGDLAVTCLLDGHERQVEGDTGEEISFLEAV